MPSFFSPMLIQRLIQLTQIQITAFVRRLKLTSLAIVALITIALMLWVIPAQAFQAQVTPRSPRLGDTLTVSILNPQGAISKETQTSPPTVTWGAKNYPMFERTAGQYRVLLPTTPLDRPGRLTLKVNADQETQTLNLNLRPRTFPTQSIWLPPGKDADISDDEFNQVDAFKAIVSPEKLWQGKFRRPNGGEITTGYGIRRYYNGKFAQDYYHRGVDYAGGYGSAIVAPAAGRVALVGYEAKGFKIHGNCVGIDHGQGVTSIYLHMSRIEVKPGDLVSAGQKIGALGSTGAATGPHLHWGLYVQGKSVDPSPWRYGSFD